MPAVGDAVMLRTLSTPLPFDVRPRLCSFVRTLTRFFGAISRIWMFERVVMAALPLPNSSAMSANPLSCAAVSSPAGIRQRSMKLFCAGAT